MLPEEITYVPKGYLVRHFDNDSKVLDTELLQLCWMVEETLTQDARVAFIHELVDGLMYWKHAHTTWQQRVIALAKVKGVEIV